VFSRNLENKTMHLYEPGSEVNSVIIIIASVGQVISSFNNPGSTNEGAIKKAINESIDNIQLSTDCISALKSLLHSYGVDI
jgi:hypothetical protein